MAGRIAYLGNIVTQGLVLDLDAAIQGSYPKTGTLWTDISGNNNNGTLVNGPAYTGSDYGAIVFDGVDDYVTGSLQDSSLYTLGIWIKVTTYTIGGGLFGGGNNGIYLQLGGGNTWQFFDAFTGNVGPTLGQWAYIVGVKGTTNDSLYRNASIITSAPSAGISLGTSFKIARRFDGILTNCQVGIAQIYNRALSQAEITQNFNALRGRYGI